jgi:hypothetical protein
MTVLGFIIALGLAVWVAAMAAGAWAYQLR